MNSLAYKDFKFLLSSPGGDSVFRFMTMYLMGEVNEFTLIQQADTSNHFITSSVFFKNEVERIKVLDCLEKKEPRTSGLWDLYYGITNK